MGTEEKIYAVVGVNGAGAISDIYLKNMTERFPTLKVKALCSRRFEKAGKKAAEYGILAMTWEEMLADPEITMIVNLTPADAHYQIIKDALLAGKHVFTEKILAATAEEGKELCALADENHLYLGSAPETFMGSAGQTARKALDDGKIGEVVSFHIQANRDLDFLTSLFPSLRVPGGGIGMDYGVYYLTALFNLLPPVRRVCGIIRNPAPVRKNRIPDHPQYGQEYTIADETQLYGMLELVNGVCGTIHLNGDSIAQDEGGIYLYGNKGHLHLPCPNFMGKDVALIPESPEWDKNAEREILKNEYFFGDNARGIGAVDLAYAIHYGCRPRVSKELAYHVLEVFEGLYKSSESRMWVDIHSTFERPAPMPSVRDVREEQECFL